MDLGESLITYPITIHANLWDSTLKSIEMRAWELWNFMIPNNMRTSLYSALLRDEVSTRRSRREARQIDTSG